MTEMGGRGESWAGCAKFSRTFDRLHPWYEACHFPAHRQNVSGAAIIFSEGILRL
jgi:hypothetical protein